MSYWLSQAVYSIGQSTTENYTNVRVDLYFDRDSGSAWNNYTTYGYIIVDGQRQDFSVGSYGTASRIHLATRDFRVYHNSDGTKTVNYTCYFNADNNPYVGALSSSGSYTCPTIPRAAPITNVSYTNIYSSFYTSFTSYSSSFNYKLRVSIPNVVALETYSNYTSGATKTLSVEKQKYLVDYLCKNNKTSDSLGFVIETYSGSTKIGESSESTKTFVKPAVSVLSGMSVSNIDSSVTFTLSKTTYWSYYGHTLTIKYGTLVLYSGAYSNSVTVSNSTTMSQLYTAMKNVSSGTFTATLTSTYGSYTIGSSTKTATGTIINANPTLTGSLAYYDANGTITAVTGNNQIIVQGKSNLTFRIPGYSLKKNAGVQEYKLYVDGTPYSVSPNSEISVGVINHSGAVSANLSLTDTRLKSASSSVTPTVTAYSAPSISWDYYRSNSAGTKDLLTGTYVYVLPTFGVAKVAGNAVKSTSLKINDASVSTSLVSGVGANYGGSYAINQSYPLEISVTDKLGGVTKLSGSITVAQLPFNITKDKTGIAFGTVAVNNQITLGKKTQAQQEIFSNGSFNKGSWNAPKTGLITQIIDNSNSQHSVIVGRDSLGNRHYGLDFYDNTSSRVARLYAGTNYLELGSTTTINGDKILTLNKAFPVNSIYLTYTNINPGTFLGGTWSLIGQNRYIVGAGSSYSGGATGGSSTTGGTAITTAQMPSHSHVWNPGGHLSWTGAGSDGSGLSLGGGGDNQETTKVGGGQAHTHSFTPYYIALYIWRRTA